MFVELRASISPLKQNSCDLDSNQRRSKIASSGGRLFVKCLKIALVRAVILPRVCAFAYDHFAKHNADTSPTSFAWAVHVVSLWHTNYVRFVNHLNFSLRPIV